VTTYGKWQAFSKESPFESQ